MTTPKKRKRARNPLEIGLGSVESYPLYTTEDLYKEQPPPMVIESFLPAAGVMGITSYPGVGKTWLALEVVRAVAAPGERFLGKFETTQGGVIFVGSDSSVYDYARQWKRLTVTLDALHGAKHFDAARFLLASPFVFDYPDEVRKLIATCRRFEWGEEEERSEGEDFTIARRKGVDVIVFDTLSRLTHANQNDNTEMENVFRNIRSIAELTDAACILLHHNAKKSEFNDGSDWRGAMSQIGALDSWCHLTPSRKDKYLVGVQYKKFRGIQPEDFAYRMDVTDPATASIRASDEPVTTQQRLNHDPLAEALMTEVMREARTLAALRESMWPTFNGNGFDDEAKFGKAIENRLRAAAARGKVSKTYNQQGRIVYGPPQEQVDQPTGA